jgi:hypothetical protein
MLSLLPSSGYGYIYSLILMYLDEQTDEQTELKSQSFLLIS